MDTPYFHTALVSIAEHCDIGCRFCFRAEAGRGEMTLETFTRTLSRLVEQGVSAICLTGGEPTDHPRIHQFMRLAAQFGIACSIVSAARIPERVTRLKDVRTLLSHLTISADSSEVMALGRTTRCFQSAVQTLIEVSVPSSSISWTFFNVDNAELQEIRGVSENAGMRTEFCPLVLESAQLKRFGLNENTYTTQLDRDLNSLSKNGFNIETLKPVVRALKTNALGQKCSSPRLYVGTQGDLRKCPYCPSEISVFSARQVIKDHLLVLKDREFRMPVSCAGGCSV